MSTDPRRWGLTRPGRKGATLTCVMCGRTRKVGHGTRPKAVCSKRCAVDRAKISSKRPAPPVPTTEAEAVAGATDLMRQGVWYEVGGSHLLPALTPEEYIRQYTHDFRTETRLGRDAIRAAFGIVEQIGGGAANPLYPDDKSLAEVVAKRYPQQGMKEIARELGVGKDRVRRALTLAGVKIRQERRAA